MLNYETSRINVQIKVLQIYYIVETIKILKHKQTQITSNREKQRTGVSAFFFYERKLYERRQNIYRYSRRI